MSRPFLLPILFLQRLLQLQRSSRFILFINQGFFVQKKKKIAKSLETPPPTHLHGIPLLQESPGGDLNLGKTFLYVYDMYLISMYYMTRKSEILTLSFTPPLRLLVTSGLSLDFKSEFHWCFSNITFYKYPIFTRWSDIS